MLTRDQKYTLRLVGYRLGLFIPRDMINYISNINIDPESKVVTLLKYLASSQPAGVIALLDENPRLLLEAGNVVTAAGHTILGVTPYEFVLGEGDYYKDNQGIDMIRLVASYFAKIPDGENERLKQYARYKPAIENILNEKPTPMIEWIFDVLEKNSDFSVWLNALEKFRNDQELTTRVIRKPEMHCKYVNSMHVLQLYRERFDNLLNSAGGTLRKCNMAFTTIVLYVMCGVTGSDRMRLSNGLKYSNEPLTRSLTFRNGNGFFPANVGINDSLMIDIFNGNKGAVKKLWRARVVGRESQISFLKFCVLLKLRALRAEGPNPMLEMESKLEKRCTK